MAEHPVFMGHWAALRSKARMYHGLMRATCSGGYSAVALLAAAAESTGIHAYPVPAGDSLLDGGEAVLDREAGVIWYNRDIEPTQAAFYIAHEYAHFWLDGTYARCVQEDVDAQATEEPGHVGVQQVEGYGPEERREREANVFAREFLLPTDVIRQWYEAEGLDATAIADRVGVSEAMVLHQLSYAVLTPGIADAVAADNAPIEPPALDASQQEAAVAACGPILVEAGPGTGKTRTLVGRIVHLVRQDVEPSSILALTFSNKAAEELRSRVGLVAPDAAGCIWMGTFHAFGLELLRKFGTRLGLLPRISVIDPVEALFLLERLLPSLGLEYYQNLYEPTLYLRDLFAAISRAKDELVDPAGYTTLAEQMRAQAQTHEEVEAAEKACEVARVYTVYQDYLQQHFLLDFGDLIFQPVILLQSHHDIQTIVQQTYTHILVDEYQDVNRASSLLLREIAGAGEGLWVVGDTRQAIYRFRGAAPRNMRLFATDFPGATLRSLRHNYRSQPRIVAVFAALASQMRATEDAAFVPWEAVRPDSGGRVHLEIVEDTVAEGTALAHEIIRQQEAGIPYRDQAVLCRTHTALARTAVLLEQAGIPVFYLSNLFERAEIRDLLSLLSLACEGHGRGLIRVARFSEYQIPLADVQILLALASEQDLPFPRALTLAPNAQAISPQGKRGLALLARHLDDFCYGSNAWSLLTRYLFGRSDYLRVSLQDTSVAGQQQRAAIYQFLECAYEYRNELSEDGTETKRAFLRYIRRLETFGEDKQFRKLPQWSVHIDAVQLLTIHASKGLEFGAVYLPCLNQGYLPARRQPQPCPPPTGMLMPDDQESHQEEEECLFFVALSRARDVLFLSHVRRSGKRKSNPSPLLASIESLLVRSTTHQMTTCSNEAAPDTVPLIDSSLSDSSQFNVDMLELYMRCPRQYYYEADLGLRGRRTDSSYLQFHRCAYDVIRWLLHERAASTVLTQEAVQERLTAAWEEGGPRNHPYETIYRQHADLLVSQAFARCVQSAGQTGRPTWEVPLTYGTVSFTPDFTEVRQGTAGESIVVQRWRTGRLSQSERDKEIYALYQAGAERVYAAAKRSIQIVSLSTNQVEDIRLPERAIATRLERYDAAMAGIRRRAFPAQPSDRVCPRCPHYFICPVAEDASPSPGETNS